MITRADLLAAAGDIDGAASYVCGFAEGERLHASPSPADLEYLLGRIERDLPHRRAKVKA